MSNSTTSVYICWHDSHSWGIQIHQSSGMPVVLRTFTAPIMSSTYPVICSNRQPVLLNLNIIFHLSHIHISSKYLDFDWIRRIKICAVASSRKKNKIRFRIWKTKIDPVIMRKLIGSWGIANETLRQKSMYTHISYLFDVGLS